MLGPAPNTNGPGFPADALSDAPERCGPPKRREREAGRRRCAGVSLLQLLLLLQLF